MKIFIAILSIVLVSNPGYSKEGSSNIVEQNQFISTFKDSYVELKVNNKYKIKLPSKWKLLNHSGLNFVNDLTKKIMGNQKYKIPENTVLQINSYNSKQEVLGQMQIRQYPKMTTNQLDVSKFSAVDLKEVDDALKKNVYDEESLLRKSEDPRLKSYKIISWGGSRLYNINSILVIITNYKRSNFESSYNMDVSLVRVVDGPESFVITISSREDAKNEQEDSKLVIGSISK